MEGGQNLLKISESLHLIKIYQMRPPLAWSISSLRVNKEEVNYQKVFFIVLPLVTLFTLWHICGCLPPVTRRIGGIYLSGNKLKQIDFQAWKTFRQSLLSCLFFKWDWTIQFNRRPIHYTSALVSVLSRTRIQEGLEWTPTKKVNKDLMFLNS
jgi:hypothetical protein